MAPNLSTADVQYARRLSGRIGRPHTKGDFNVNETLWRTLPIRVIGYVVGDFGSDDLFQLWLAGGDGAICERSSSIIVEHLPFICA
jgi:hypothetical protein